MTKGKNLTKRIYKKGIKNVEDVKRAGFIIRSLSQSSKFIALVIKINEFYHIKYLSHNWVTIYLFLLLMNDEDCVELSNYAAYKVD